MSKEETKATAKPVSKEETKATRAQPVSKEDATRIAREYVAKLLAGEVPPENEYVADLVTQLRESDREAGQLSNRISATENDLQAMKDRRLILTGLAQQLGATLIQWRARADAKK